MTVLVVDEDAVFAERVQEWLEEKGHSCLIAPDVYEAEWTIEVARVDAMAVRVEAGAKGSLDLLEAVCLGNPDLAERSLVVTRGDIDSDAVRRIEACGASVIRCPDEQELRSSILDRIRKMVGTPGESRRPFRLPRRRHPEPTEEH